MTAAGLRDLPRRARQRLWVGSCEGELGAHRGRQRYPVDPRQDRGPRPERAVKGRPAMRRPNMAAIQASGKAGRGSEPAIPSPSAPGGRAGPAALTENQDGARAHHRGGSSAAEPSGASEVSPRKAAIPCTTSHRRSQSRVSAVPNRRKRPASSGWEVTLGTRGGAARGSARVRCSPGPWPGEEPCTDQQRRETPRGGRGLNTALPSPRWIRKAPGPGCHGRPRLGDAVLHAHPLRQPGGLAQPALRDPGQTTGLRAAAPVR